MPLYIAQSNLSIQNTTTKENETLLAVGTAFVQGEDVAGRGRILLFSFGKDGDNSLNLVTRCGLFYCIFYITKIYKIDQLAPHSGYGGLLQGV